MSVLMVAQPVDGGVVTHVAQLAAHAREAGVDVTVACPEGMLADAAADLGIRRVAVDLTRAPGPRDAAAVLALRPHMAGVDVVHLHSSKAGAVGRLAATGLGRRRPAVLFTPHAWSWSVGGRMAAAYRMVERTLAPLADVIVAVGEEERRAGRDVLGRSAGRRLRLVPNGVDEDRFAPDGPVAPRGAQPLLVCVGRLSRQKGQDTAIRALADLPGVRLRLVGDGEDRAALADLAAALGVGDRVEVVGWSDDVAPHYRAADAVLVPSRWDGLSLSLLEALSTGRPVVASTASGDRTLGDVAVLVPPDAPDALATAVRDLLADPARGAALGAAARARVLARHTLTASLETTLALYREALAGRRQAVGRVPRSPG